MTNFLISDIEIINAIKDVMYKFLKKQYPDVKFTISDEPKDMTKYITWDRSKYTNLMNNNILYLFKGYINGLNDMSHLILSKIKD